MAPVGGVIVSMTRMNRLSRWTSTNRCAVVEPGLINLWLSNATRDRGWFFAPDPSSQMVSTIGGNASTNAGGPHCLKYGITVNDVLGLQVVTGAGELIWLGGKAHERPGYDLTGVMVGAEGTLGLITAVTVRLTHLPEGVKTLLASFAAIEDASEAVSAIIAAGIIPAALEMIDEVMVRAIEEGVGAGYPKDAGRRPPHRARRAPGRDRVAVGPHRGDLLVARGARGPGGRRRRGAGAALEGPQGGGRRGGPAHAQLVAAGRGGAALATAEIMREMIAIGGRHGLVLANVFHAGDGNLHPIICYDEQKPGELERAKHGERGAARTPASPWAGR